MTFPALVNPITILQVAKLRRISGVWWVKPESKESGGGRPGEAVDGEHRARENPVRENRPKKLYR